MVKKILFGFMFAALCGVCFAQQARVAVAPFTATSGNAASDAETIAEIFGIELQAKNVARVYTRGNTLAVMNEHRFQMSDLSNDTKTASLGKAANADWVVRGQVQKLGAMIVVTASLLDVNTLEIMGGAPMYLNAIEEAATKMDGFITTITQRVASGTTTNRVQSGGTSTTGIGIKVLAEEAGTLFFNGKEIATMWGTDTYTIEIDKPGTYTVVFKFANGREKKQNVEIKSRSIVDMVFNNDYLIGEQGPGGGTVFYAQGGKYKECSIDLGEFNWNTAVATANNYRGGGLGGWRLPNKDELNLIYYNLKVAGLGGTFVTEYWSSSENNIGGAWGQNFSNGSQLNYNSKNGTHCVRAVRAF
ncbi:hypothetical protein AGMMS50268_38860 [Spirochaetia bacterium]|nr:hypothetical protein AGMMS50268_38860 [Spirochaetia bacterium]